MGLKETLKENFKNVKNLEDLKYVDRRILIVGGTILFVVLGLYYYYLIGVYLPHKQDVRDKAAQEATKQQELLTQQQDQVKKVSDALMNASLPPSKKTDISPQNNPNQSNAVDIFKIPRNYMNISRIPSKDSEMYFDSFDVLYDYFNQVFQGNYSSAYSYLNKDFVNQNNITPDSFTSYVNKFYLKSNEFYIYNVIKDGVYYSVDLTIYDKENPSLVLSATYKLANINGKYSIVIDNLSDYVKTKAN